MEIETKFVISIFISQKSITSERGEVEEGYNIFLIFFVFFLHLFYGLHQKEVEKEETNK